MADLLQFPIKQMGQVTRGAVGFANRWNSSLTDLVSSPLERAQETMAPIADKLGLPVTLDERVIEAGNDYEGMTVGSNPKQLMQPRFWPKLTNPFRPSWGEPYDEIAARMDAAIHDEAPRGNAPVYATFGEATLRDASCSTQRGHEQDLAILVWAKRGSAASAAAASTNPRRFMTSPPAAKHRP